MTIESSLLQMKDLIGKLGDLGLDVSKITSLTRAHEELSEASLKQVEFPAGTPVTLIKEHVYHFDTEMGEFKVPVGAKGVVDSNFWSFTNELSANVRIKDDVDGSAANVIFGIPQEKLKKA